MKQDYKKNTFPVAGPIEQSLFQQTMVVAINIFREKGYTWLVNSE